MEVSMRLLRQLFQRYRHWMFKGLYYKFGAIKPSPYNLLRMITDIDPHLLSYYTPEIGKRITLFTGFRNTDHLLTWIDVLIANMEQLIPVADRVNIVIVQQDDITLEDFLTNARGTTVSPVYLHRQLLESLHQLFVTYHGLPPSHQKDHYTRRIELLCPNITSILEGLLLVALNV